MKFGENLYNLRKKQKMSQEKLAEKVGVSRQSISKWENGDAYPEMNRILKLCNIFHCQLNDLVNDKIVDIDSLDEDVKMNVVKFEKEKQKNLKIVSKTIMVCAKVLQIIAIIVSVIILIGMFIVPHAINNVNISENNVIIYDRPIQEFSVDNNSINTVIDVFSTHSKVTIIVYTEIILLSLIISVLLISAVMYYLSELFKNINESNTPFTLDNMKCIKKVAIFLIVYLLFPDIAGTLFQWITKINMNIDYETTKIFYILIIVCIYYVFDYGHQIQLDSKGRIYGDGNE